MHHSDRRSWVRENTTLEQVEWDKLECRGVPYFKEGATVEETVTDYQFCGESQVARKRHLQTTQIMLGWGQLVGGPLVGTAGLVVSAMPRENYCDRCMKAKGYIQQEVPEEKWANFIPCMEGKGYKWK